MEICAHCHNVLPKTVDRCTVCGTSRVDPAAADVRRREDGEQPSHAPGWAAPLVPEAGIHPDDFLRELAGDEPADPTPPATPPIEQALPPRAIPATPAPGALAGYLGTTVDRRSDAADEPASRVDQEFPPPPPASGDAQAVPAEAGRFDQHLSTATHVAADGVAARTTRLDGTVKLGATESHRLLTLGTPLLAGLLLIGGVVASYRIRTSEAEEVEAAEAIALDVAAVSESASSVVRLDLDGCGIIDQTTGFLFANNTIVVPQSRVVTDNRPSVVVPGTSTWPAEVLGWSLTRNLAVVRTDERMPGGLEWGLSSRVRQGDAVSVLAITAPGVAAPVAATISATNTINGRNASFDLDIEVAEGSMVLNADGFVVGVIDGMNQAQASDDVAPAMSRVVLDNDRPQAVCPTPPTTMPPPTTLPEDDGTETDGTKDSIPDE